MSIMSKLPLLSSLLMGATIVLSPLSTLAENELCGAVVEPEELSGSYELSLGNALIFGDGKSVPLQDSQTLIVNISIFAGGLIMESEGFAVDLELFGNEDTREWYWEALGGVVNESSEDYARIVGCEINKLPRIIGRGMSTSSEGMPVNYVYYFVIEQFDDAESGPTMFGSLTWNSGGIKMVRAVRLVPVGR